MSTLSLSPLSRLASLAPLAVRLIVGIIMLAHGWQKLTEMGPGNFGGQMLAGLGVPLPVFTGYVVTFVEIIGGILLIVGFLTQIAGILIALDMLGAILFAYLLKGAPFIENGAISWETEAVFAAAALCIVLAGPGAWSVEDAVAGNRTRVVT